MKRLLLLTTMLLKLSIAGAASNPDEHVVVITNQDSPVETLSKAQLKNIFMGNLILDNITPVALSPGEVARSIFNVRVVGLTESRIQAYWAQMRFSGRLKRPDNADSIEDLIIRIRSSSDLIGYVPEGTPLPDDVKVIYRSSQP